MANGWKGIEAGKREGGLKMVDDLRELKEKMDNIPVTFTGWPDEVPLNKRRLLLLLEEDKEFRQAIIKMIDEEVIKSNHIKYKEKT